MSSDSQSIDKVAVKVYDVQSGTVSSDKVTECKVEVTREGHGKNSDFCRESEKLDEEDDDETCHHSMDTVSSKKVVSTKTNTKADRNVRSEKLRSQTGRRRESRFDDEKKRNVSSRNGGGSGRKVFLLPISTGGYSGCSSSRNGRHNLCHIKSSQRNKYSHSHSFHGGNRVILITTPLSCCCCCQRKKR